MTIPTTYFIISGDNPELQTAVENTYLGLRVHAEDNLDEDEKLVWTDEASIAEGGQGRKITGTSRATQAHSDAMESSHNENLTITDTWPVDWVFPPDPKPEY